MIDMLTPAWGGGGYILGDALDSEFETYSLKKTLFCVTI